jgi:hypothetical protein
MPFIVERIYCTFGNTIKSTQCIGEGKYFLYLNLTGGYDDVHCSVDVSIAKSEKFCNATSLP